MLNHMGRYPLLHAPDLESARRPAATPTPCWVVTPDISDGCGRGRADLRQAEPVVKPCSSERKDLTEVSLGRRLAAPTPQLCAITDIGVCRSNNQDDFFLS